MSWWSYDDYNDNDYDDNDYDDNDYDDNANNDAALKGGARLQVSGHAQQHLQLP